MLTRSTLPTILVVATLPLVDRLRSSLLRPPLDLVQVLFLDSQMRIHRTGEGNIFVQGRPDWRADVMA